MKYNLTGADVASANRQDEVPHTISRRRKLTSCMAIAIAGVTMMTTYDAEAVDGKKKAKKTAKAEQAVNELQAQVDRLNQELLASKKREQTLLRNSASGTTVVTPNGSVPSVAVTEPSLDVVQADVSALEEKEEKPEKAKDLGEVVVRSRQRIEKLQDVPLSVSVVTGKDLEREQSMDLGAITKRAANITWNQGNQRTSSLAIRGIGKIGQTEAQDPSVGVIVDGVNYAYNPLTSSYDFTDVDAVEVTRGPQGTLQGKGATMGVVNILTKRPTFTNTADYSLTYGNYDSYIAKGAVGGPGIDGLLAWRGSFVTQKQRGFVTNAWNQDSTFQNIDRLTGRAQFLLTPTENFNARLSVNITPNAGENTNGGVIYTPTPNYSNNPTVPITSTTSNLGAASRLTRDWFTRSGMNYSYNKNFLYGGGQNAVDQNTQQPVVTGSDGASLEMNWDVLNHHLTSLTAFQGYHFNAATNDDGTPFNIMANAGGYSNYYHQLSQELRFSSKTGGLVDYTGGIFLMQTENKTAYNKSFGSDAGAWYASDAQYTSLNASAAGQRLMENSLNNLWLDTNHQDIKNQSEAVFGQTNLHFTDDITLTTGFRVTNEHRENPNSVYIINEGSGAALNPVAINGINTGGFNSSASSGALTGVNTADQLKLADQVAHQYYGTAITNTPGAAYNSLLTNGAGGLTGVQVGKQIAGAKAIRLAQVGNLWNTTTPVYNGILPSWTISPSYKIDENHTTYVSWQHGMKAGIAQSFNGVDAIAAPETDDSYEIGLKSIMFEKTLVLNADLFWADIKNYQAGVATFNTYTAATNPGTPPYSTITGNVPLARTAGLELDGVFNGLPFTSIRFAGSYTDAIYVKYANAPNPADIQVNAANQAGWNATGRTLPGASKFNLNISPEVRIPVELLGIDFLPKTELHTSFTETYASRYNSDASLSNYAWIPYQFNTDFSFGIGRRDKMFDVSFVAKNLLNNHTPVLHTLNTYTPASPQWIGLQLSGKF